MEVELGKSLFLSRIRLRVTVRVRNRFIYLSYVADNAFSSKTDNITDDKTRTSCNCRETYNYRTTVVPVYSPFDSFVRKKEIFPPPTHTQK